MKIFIMKLKKRKSSVERLGIFQLQEVMIMLMRICANCGRKLPQGAKCICRNDRHKIYNAERRDQEKNSFYHSAAWNRLVEMVKARANGLDEYALAQGIFEVGNTVHHIYPVDERPDLKTSIDNLIFLSAKNHNRVHKIYGRDLTSKKILQAKLRGIIRSGGG